MQGAGDDFLAGAAFAFDEYGRISGRDLLDELLHAVHLGTDVEERGELGFVGELVLEIGVLLLEVALLGELGDGQLELAGGEGLEQVVRRAHLHRLDGRLDRAEAGDDDDLDVGVGGLELAEEFHAAAVGQLQVGDDEVGRFLGLFLAGLEAGADGEDGGSRVSGAR